MIHKTWCLMLDNEPYQIAGWRSSGKPEWPASLTEQVAIIPARWLKRPAVASALKVAAMEEAAKAKKGGKRGK